MLPIRHAARVPVPRSTARFDRHALLIAATRHDPIALSTSCTCTLQCVCRLGAPHHDTIHILCHRVRRCHLCYARRRRHELPALHRSGTVSVRRLRAAATITPDRVVLCVFLFNTPHLVPYRRNATLLASLQQLEYTATSRNNAKGGLYFLYRNVCCDLRSRHSLYRLHQL